MSTIVSKKVLTNFCFLLVALLIIGTVSVQADEDNGDDDDDDDDDAKDLAYASIGLFVVSGITVVIYQTHKYSRKFLRDEGKQKETKNRISNFYRVIRKPMNYIHYFVGIVALTILLVHGIKLTDKDEKLVAIGWVTTAIYIFYILSGIIIWFRIKPLWNFSSIRKLVNRIHRSLLLFLGIVAIHILHVIMAD